MSLWRGSLVTPCLAYVSSISRILHMQLMYWYFCNQGIEGRIIGLWNSCHGVSSCLDMLVIHEELMTIIMVLPISSIQIWYRITNSNSDFIWLMAVRWQKNSEHCGQCQLLIGPLSTVCCSRDSLQNPGLEIYPWRRWWDMSPYRSPIFWGQYNLSKGWQSSARPSHHFPL